MSEDDAPSSKTRKSRKMESRKVKSGGKNSQNTDSRNIVAFPTPVTPNYINIRKSTIPKAGRGLFAAAEIPKGQFITYYSGEIVDEFPDYSPIYAFELRIETKKKKGIYLDGAKPIDPSHLGYLINHYPKGRNVKIVYDANPRRNPKRLIKFVSIRNIHEGEEIFWDYGADFWSDKPTPSSPVSKRKSKMADSM